MKRFFLLCLGLQDLESTVTALVDIIHAFTISDSTHAPMAVDLYVKMLLCEVSIATKYSSSLIIYDKLAILAI